jgi:outer membrane lipoprotein SlyB
MMREHDDEAERDDVMSARCKDSQAGQREHRQAVARGRCVLIGLVAMLALTACVHRSVNDVALGDAGQSFKVKFGTVLAVKAVNLRSEPGNGASIGLVAGGGAGAGFGRSTSATVGGALAGALVGALAQEIAETGNGYEYTIAFADGGVEVIDQMQAADDPVFTKGAAVMVQYGASRNRVLAADHLPTDIAQPKQVVVAGAPKARRSLGVSTCQKSQSGNSERKTCTDE